MAQEEVNNTENDMAKSLRSYKPELYTYITDELEELHIHPYDIQLDVVEHALDIDLIIRYGNGFAHEHKKTFSLQSVEKMDDELVQFIKETGEICKETMIADYFKMMKI